VVPIRNSKWVQCARAISVLAACWLTACGGDDDDSEKVDDKPVSTVKIGELPCGPSSCPPYTELPGVTACCKDVFAGTCGVKTKSFDDCREPPVLDSRCVVPEPIAGGLFGGREVAYGCCMPSNECGLAVFSELDFTNPIFSALIGEQGFPEGCFSIRDVCSEQDAESLGFQPQTCDGEPLDFNVVDCGFPTEPIPEEEPAP
jgi:hypothetical protein